MSKHQKLPSASKGNLVTMPQKPPSLLPPVPAVQNYGYALYAENNPKPATPEPPKSVAPTPVDGKPGTKPIPAFTTVITGYKSCKIGHNGMTPVKVGKYTIYLGAETYLSVEALEKADVLIPLNGELPSKLPFAKGYKILSARLADYGGVPSTELWDTLLTSVIRELRAGKRVLAWCAGSHGRTGTLLASLIAKLEPSKKDPIREARKRHCNHCVESEKQVIAVYNVLGKPVPVKYKNEFTPTKSWGSSWGVENYGNFTHPTPHTATPTRQLSIKDLDYVYFDCANLACGVEIKKSTHDYDDWEKKCPECKGIVLKGPYITAKKSYSTVHQVQVGKHPKDNQKLTAPVEDLTCDFVHHAGCLCSVCSAVDGVPF